jgi:hypothetical protein
MVVAVARQTNPIAVSGRRARQQSRLYSNQISQDAVQSMEIITGVAPAEYGDKTSLVVHIVTKSGLDSRLTGSLSGGNGSFRSPTTDISIGGFHLVVRQPKWYSTPRGFLG